MTPANASTALATALLDELARCGVRDVVLAPGSRSAALAFAAHRLQDRVRLHTRIDERSAGFLALGIARTSRRPVVVVTTTTGRRLVRARPTARKPADRSSMRVCSRTRSRAA